MKILRDFYVAMMQFVLVASSNFRRQNMREEIFADFLLAQNTAITREPDLVNPPTATPSLEFDASQFPGYNLFFVYCGERTENPKLNARYLNALRGSFDTSQPITLDNVAFYYTARIVKTLGLFPVEAHRCLMVCLALFRNPLNALYLRLMLTELLQGSQEQRENCLRKTFKEILPPADDRNQVLYQHLIKLCQEIENLKSSTLYSQVREAITAFEEICALSREPGQSAQGLGDLAKHAFSAQPGATMKAASLKSSFFEPPLLTVTAEVTRLNGTLQCIVDYPIDRSDAASLTPLSRAIGGLPPNTPGPLRRALAVVKRVVQAPQESTPVLPQQVEETATAAGPASPLSAGDSELGVLILSAPPTPVVNLILTPDTPSPPQEPSVASLMKEFLDQVKGKLFSFLSDLQSNDIGKKIEEDVEETEQTPKEKQRRKARQLRENEAKELIAKAIQSFFSIIEGIETLSDFLGQLVHFDDRELREVFRPSMERLASSLESEDLTAEGALKILREMLACCTAYMTTGTQGGTQQIFPSQRLPKQFQEIVTSLALEEQITDTLKFLDTSLALGDAENSAVLQGKHLPPLTIEIFTVPYLQECAQVVLKFLEMFKGHIDAPAAAPADEGARASISDAPAAAFPPERASSCCVQ